MQKIRGCFKRNRPIGIFSKLVLITSLFVGAGISHAQQCQSSLPVWADEFDGNSLDSSKWEAMLGDGCSYGICGWGNNELQSYQAENATVANGVLSITAKKQRVQAKAYTSARLRTANMPNGGEWTNGRFEARIKLPDGTGMWPAFWMLPTDPNVGWPVSGEIDILEATGQADMFAFGTIHYGQPYPNNEWTSNRILKQPDAWSDGFHTYAIEWEPNEMRWYVDNLLYSVKTPADMSDSSYWTFENFQYHFLLNMAVGGNIGGAVDDSMLPQTMQVDYVRVYDFAEPSMDGEHLVEPGSTATYRVIDEQGTGSSYTWSIPADATIAAGANTNTVTINWGATSGDVSVNVSNSCGARNLTTNVYVAPQLNSEFVHEDFESNRNLTYTTATGSFNQSAANPAPDAINSSSTVAFYTRNVTELFDVIVADTLALSDINPYVIGDKAFYLDLFTNAPIGTELLIQLEDNSVATPSNYPQGRHSKYIAHSQEQGVWQRLKFKMEDRIDGATSDTAVNSIVMLIAANSLTGDDYYWDNFASYGTAGGVNSAPTSSFVSNCSELSCSFDGSASTDSDGTIDTYTWDLGDGSSSVGSNVSHSYVADGTYSVELTVTDNVGASASSTQSISVSSGSQQASSMTVSSVTTSTQSAGKGQKYAKATIVVLDNLGNPVENAIVSGDFSGTIVEAGASDATDASGTATLLSTSSSSGNLSVSFCVNSVSITGLSFDATGSTGLCQ